MLKSAKLAIAKVPSNDSEALKSSLMGMIEKTRCMKFYKFIENIDWDKKETWKDLNLNVQPMSDVYKKYGLDSNTIDFLGHAVALHTSDAYLQKPARDTIEKMQLYLESIGRYGDSPFLYPLYGLGGLPEAFSRLCAIHGGTYMLNTKIDEILFENGKVKGVRSGDKTATAPLVICDPSYCTPEFIKCDEKVIRAICLLNHPIPNTKDAPSIQIILPAK
jgi:Rab GDP dissociation inhibitor